MKLNLRSSLCILSLSVGLTAHSADAQKALVIETPPGMKRVEVDEGNAIRVKFVPIDDAAPVAEAPKLNAEAAPKPTAADAASAPGKTPLTGGNPAASGLLNGLNLDRPIGEVPAFTALGLSPDTVSHPSSPRDFAAGVLNGTDRHGVLQTGVAMETAPFRWHGWPGADLSNYKTSWFKRFLYNSSLSIATAKASEKDRAVQLAIGYSAILFQDQESDPITSSALTKAFRKANEDNVIVGGGFDDAPTPSSANVNKALVAALKDFHDNSWTGSVWKASIAPTWTSADGTYGGLGSTGFSAWTTFAHGYSAEFLGAKTKVQLSAQVSYRQGELVTDPNDEKHTAKQDSLIAAGRLRVGSVDFNGFAEGGYVRLWHGLAGNVDGWRAAAGLEKRIGANTWFVLSAGQEFGTQANGGDESFAVGSIRFALDDTPRFDLAAKK